MLIKAIYIVVSILLGAAGALLAQTPVWEWAQGAGGTGYESGNAIAVDAAGNSYVAGYFEGTISVGGTAHTSYGNGDIFIAKLSPGGDWLWFRQAGGSLYDYAYDLALDANANLLVCGYYRGTGYFGPDTLSTAGTYAKTFVSKLDSSGNGRWSRHGAG